MDINYFFGKHAQSRINRRTRLSVKQVNTTLRRGRCVIVHTEPGPIGIKEHKLFYSLKDDKFYIAVVTQDTKEVMTVLHDWQHRSCYKKITPEQFDEAKALIPATEAKPETEAQSELPPATFLVKVSYGEDQKVTNLFKSISSDYDTILKHCRE